MHSFNLPGKLADLNRGVKESTGPRLGLGRSARCCGLSGLVLVRTGLSLPSRQPASASETWTLACSKRADLLMYVGVGACLFLTWIALFLDRYVPGPIASGSP